MEKDDSGGAGVADGSASFLGQENDPPFDEPFFFAEDSTNLDVEYVRQLSLNLSSCLELRSTTNAQPRKALLLDVNGLRRSKIFSDCLGIR